MRKRLAAAALLAVAAVLPVHAGADAAIRVGVSIAPQKFLLERIGRQRVQVTVMLEPGQVPETFEPTPRQIAALAGSRLYFRVGVPFEDAWLDSLQSGNAGVEIVQCCAQFALSADAAEHADPHVWVSPVAAVRIAEQMRRELARIDPINKRFYDANYRRLSAELARLNFDIRDLLRRRRTSYFIISHDSLGQFAETYGLKQLALEAGGKAAGPRTIAEIIRRAREEKIDKVFVQKEFKSAAARALAKELGAEIVEIDPLSEDYITSVLEIALNVAVATR